MKFQDYYKTLDVPRDATADQIKSSYRKLARRYHPDTNSDSGAEARFKQVTEAYEVLSDPERRAQYDTVGHDHRAGQEFRPPPGFEQFFNRGGGQVDFGRKGGDAGGVDGFSDFFRTMFGGDRGGHGGMGGGAGPTMGSRPGSAGRAAPTQPDQELTISLHEAVHGSTRGLSLNGPSGSQRLDVKIPAGVNDGSRIRLAEHGVQLVIRVAPDPRFAIDGRNLTTDVRITPAQAALGDRLDVPTLDGTISLTIPPGVASGARLRVSGRGMPARKSGDADGHLLVRILVDVPKAGAMTDAQRALYEQLRALDENGSAPRTETDTSFTGTDSTEQPTE